MELRTKPETNLELNELKEIVSLFDLSAMFKIRDGEHAHYVGLVVAYIHLEPRKTNVRRTGERV